MLKTCFTKLNSSILPTIVIYGLGATTLAHDMKIEVKEAEALIHNFRNSYEGIPRLIERIQNECATTGFVETLLGRKRYLPNIFAAEMSKRYGKCGFMRQ